MKTILLAFLISLCVLPAMAEELVIPSHEDVLKIIKNETSFAVEMIQKLYVLERTDPTLSIPDLEIFYLEDGNVRIQWGGEMEIKLGTDEISQTYDVILEPRNVLVGTTPEAAFPWKIVAITGGAGLLTGIIIGAVVSR